MQEILNILGSVGFNWHVALANFFNFLIILFLLNIFFFKKIGTTIENRNKVIEHGLNQAREAETILAHAGEEKTGIVKAAHKERDTIVANAEALAKDLALTLEKEAQESIAVRMKKLEADEATLSESVEKNFLEKAPSLVAQLYAKTLMKELTPEENNAIIARINS